MHEQPSTPEYEQSSISTSGVVAIYPDESERAWTLGGPSLMLTEKDPPEYYWPDDLVLAPQANQT